MTAERRLELAEERAAEAERRAKIAPRGLKRRREAEAFIARTAALKAFKRVGNAAGRRA